MCRFASFAVPLTQQLKSSEFMWKNAVFNVYSDNPAGPGKGHAGTAAGATGGRCRCGYSPGAPASLAAKAAAWERRCMPSLDSSEDT
jgi:hypothetical protein